MLRFIGSVTLLLITLVLLAAVLVLAGIEMAVHFPKKLLSFLLLLTAGAAKSLAEGDLHYAPRRW